MIADNGHPPAMHDTKGVSVTTLRGHLSNIQMPRMACGCKELPRGRLIWAEHCHDGQVPAIRADIKDTLRMKDSRDTFSYSGILQKVDLKQMAVVILARRGP
jgi:hypothetical protein